MNKSIDKLISIGGSPLGNSVFSASISDFSACGKLGEELLYFLSQKNGFYAFESALHIFPLGNADGAMTISKWNSSDLWRHEYGDMTDGMLFFAEDAFGNQFCLYEGKICLFDAETADVQQLDTNFNDWAGHVISEYNTLTGFSILHDWQSVYGALATGSRLMPKIPFVLGGDFAIENLSETDAVCSMKSRGNLAKQIKDMPDGTQIEFRVIE